MTGNRELTQRRSNGNASEEPDPSLVRISGRAVPRRAIRLKPQRSIVVSTSPLPVDTPGFEWQLPGPTYRKVALAVLLLIDLSYWNDIR